MGHYVLDTQYYDSKPFLPVLKNYNLDKNSSI